MRIFDVLLLIDVFRVCWVGPEVISRCLKENRVILLAQCLKELYVCDLLEVLGDAVEFFLIRICWFFWIVWGGCLCPASTCTHV